MLNELMITDQKKRFIKSHTAYTTCWHVIRIRTFSPAIEFAQKRPLRPIIAQNPRYRSQTKNHRSGETNDDHQMRRNLAMVVEFDFH